MNNLRKVTLDSQLKQHEQSRIATLESQVRTLKEALEQIAKPTRGTELNDTDKERAKSFQFIARAALKGLEG